MGFVKQQGVVDINSFEIKSYPITVDRVNDD